MGHHLWRALKASAAGGRKPSTPRICTRVLSRLNVTVQPLTAVCSWASVSESSKLPTAAVCNYELSVPSTQSSKPRRHFPGARSELAELAAPTAELEPGPTGAPGVRLQRSPPEVVRSVAGRAGPPRRCCPPRTLWTWPFHTS